MARASSRGTQVHPRAMCGAPKELTQEPRYIRAMRSALTELMETHDYDSPMIEELRQGIQDVQVLVKNANAVGKSAGKILCQCRARERKLAKATKHLLKKLREHLNGILPESLRDASEAANKALARIEQSKKRMKPLLDLREVCKLRKWKKP